MRDVLIALCGLTPQVITETLWALARRNPPVYPAEVWILTTKAGRDACLEKLLGANRALARTKLHHCTRPDMPTCGDCMECFVRLTKDDWRDTLQLLKERGGGLVLEKTSDDKDAANQFRALIRKVNQRLEAAVGIPGDANPYRIRSAGPKGDTVYGLALDKTKISVA
jgi:CRISPR-associated protein (TIGR02584 family)